MMMMMTAMTDFEWAQPAGNADRGVERQRRQELRRLRKLPHAELAKVVATLLAQWRAEIAAEIAAQSDPIGVRTRREHNKRPR